jgi:hypothetical protein
MQKAETDRARSTYCAYRFLADHPWSPSSSLASDTYRRADSARAAKKTTAQSAGNSTPPNKAASLMEPRF